MPSASPTPSTRRTATGSTPALRHTLALGLLLLSVTGCSEAPDIEEATVRDSAGVRVVAHPEVDGAELEPRFEAHTRLQIGAVDGPGAEVFGSVLTAFGVGSESLVVVDRQALELRWFDLEGEFAHAVGGRGEGPGEFQGLAWVGAIRGDTILAWDHHLRRVTRFTADGDLIDVRGIPPLSEDRPMPPHTIAIDAPQPRGAMEDGTVLAELPVAFAPGGDGGFRRDTLTLFRLRPPSDDEDPEPVWEAHGPTEMVEYFLDDVGQGLQGVLVPFGRMTRTEIAPRGVVTGWEDQRGVWVEDEDGGLRMILRPGIRSVPVTPEMRDLELDRLADLLSGRGEGVRTLLENAPRHETLPAHGRIAVRPRLGMDDPGANESVRSLGIDEIWIQEPPLPGSGNLEVRWRIHDADGAFVGAVDLPRTLRITGFTDHGVIGVSTDDLGVDRVSIIEIVR